MSWHQSRSVGLRSLAAASLLALGATAASADVLVVRATGPSAKNFPAGKSLADDAKIALQANDTVVLLDARGTRTLRGPGAFTPAGPAGTQLASATTTRRARIGAVRSVGSSAAEPRTPSIWHLDVTKSSNFCIADSANLSLWRADASKAATLTVTRASGGAPQKIDWAAGQTTLQWPSGLAISDGSDYRISWDGAAKPTNVKFKTLAAKPASLNDMAASLIQRGCDAQLDLLIETVRLPEDNRPPAG